MYVGAGGASVCESSPRGNDSPLKGDLWCAPASQVLSRCLQSGAQDRVIARPLALAVQAHDEVSSDCSSVKIYECVARLMAIQSENVFILRLDLLAPLQNSHFVNCTFHIQLNYN